MVIKGKARGGASALAAHLMRHDTNEEIRLREFEGVTARDVLGALREMDAMGSGASSRRTLYHSAIAPGERLTEEQKRQAVDRLAEELGLANQPRVVVEHLKKDREHMHVVFLRIDTDRMVAIPDSHNYRKHETVARELEREFGHQHTQGAHVDRDGKKRPGRTPSHDEMQQAERTGITPQEAKKEITALWRGADSGKAFAASVNDQGWVLARGDKRAFVLVDRAGEVHSLARRIDGANAAHIKQRMSDVDPGGLPSVAEAKAQQRDRIEAGRTKEKEKDKEPAAAIAPPKLLQIAAPVSPVAPEKPLVLASNAGPATVKPKDAVKPLEPPSPKKPEPATTTQAHKAGRIKRFYDSFTAKTQGVYERARGVFEKKSPATSKSERPAKPPKEMAERKTAPELSPQQQALRQKRDAARAQAASLREAIPTKPQRAPEIENDRTRDRTRDRKRKLDREDIERLLDRQRRQRGIDGPSR